MGGKGSAQLKESQRTKIDPQEQKAKRTVPAGIRT